MIWLYQVAFPLNQGTAPQFKCIKYNQNNVIQNCISSETHKWYMYKTWKIEPINLWFTQMPTQGGVGGQNIFACLSTNVLFVEHPVVSLSLYTGAIQWLMEPSGKDQLVSNPPIWKHRSGIGDHRFTFFMDLFPNYTFYTNLTILFIWVFAYRSCDKPDNI